MRQRDNGPMELDIEEFHVPNDDGWMLHVRRAVAPGAFDPSLRPVAIVPGYGMNSFIFRFHPRGTSMERVLAEQGLEVWSVNLRAQGESRAVNSTPPPPSLRAYAENDLRAVFNAIAASTRTSHDRIDVVGCSLGGSILYAHLALLATTRLGSIVTVGSPLRWTEAHPIFRAAMASPWLAGMVPTVGTREAARMAFPLLAKIPRMLDIYMNTAHVDMSAASELVRTVEAPHPRVNRDIALWFRHRDMILRGVNVTHSLRTAEHPLLLVLSNRDGIVPDSAALAATTAWGRRPVDIHRVGNDREWYAHADLFIADRAPQDVFIPIADWLKRQ
jgi:pimeloyl-ACP methyl ester carboxylesterase